MATRKPKTTAPSRPDRKLVAVLFSDIAGYSTLKENQLITFMQVVLPRISGILGTYDRERILELNTWGDAIILVSEDISLVARFALDLRDLFRKENWAGHGLPEGLGCRIGLHSGNVFVGEDLLRGQTAFFGTQITLTARIEPITPVGQVFATDTFVSILKRDSDPTIRYDDVGIWTLTKAYGREQLYRLLRRDEEQKAFVPPATETEDREKDKLPPQVLMELNTALQTKASELLNLTAQLTQKSRALDRASSFMRSVICYNQGEYAQYNFLAAELHKALRICPNDVKVRQVHYDSLEEFLDTNLERVAQDNFQFLITEYFSGRHEINPRVCIKANYKDTIVQVVRSNKVNYLSECAIEGNSGFQFVKRNGLHVLCNKIPEGVATGTYENWRIDVRKARAYWQNRRENPRDVAVGSCWDEGWVNCWTTPGQDGPSKDVDPTSYYKSTLIIPMTLVNNKLHPTFREKIKIKTKEEMSRLIFGYLCFDHIEEDYFKEDIDVDAGYMFADILSLYMITQAIHTEFSETYREARGTIQEGLSDYSMIQG